MVKKQRRKHHENMQEYRPNEDDISYKTPNGRENYHCMDKRDTKPKNWSLLKDLSKKSVGFGKSKFYKLLKAKRHLELFKNSDYWYNIHGLKESHPDFC